VVILTIVAKKYDKLANRGKRDYLNQDGIHNRMVARATYNFAEHGGAIGAHGLGVKLPAGAVVTRSWYEVLTTCTTAGSDAGTMALKIKDANDLVSAIAVSDAGNPWDAGMHECVPDGTAAKFIKTTAESEITATIAGQAFTAGKFVVYLEYFISA
jgi:hypothetical protein